MATIKDPLYPALKGEEADRAVKGQLSYPQVIRGDKDPPVTQQSFGLVSLALFKEPKKTDTGKSIYGFFKLRGNHTDRNQATVEASKIIRKVDSKNAVKVVEVGAWTPITDEDGNGEKIDVRTEISEEDERLKRAAIKEKEDETSRIIKEIKERETEIKESKDLNDDSDSLDHYVMKMVAWLRLHENIEQLRAKQEDLTKKWKSTRKLLFDLETKHPEYAKVWLDRYNEERRKTKIPDYIPSPAEDELYQKVIM